jgi:hypothetical protein
MSKSSDLLSAAQKLAPTDAVGALWLQEAKDRLGAYRRGEIDAVPLSDVLAKYSAR